MEVAVGGTRLNLGKEDVLAGMCEEQPERVMTYRVGICGRVYLCKEVLAKTAGLPRAKFNAYHGFRILKRVSSPFLTTS